MATSSLESPLAESKAAARTVAINSLLDEFDKLYAIAKQRDDPELRAQCLLVEAAALAYKRAHREEVS